MDATSPNTHRISDFFDLHDRLQQAAELAADAQGKVAVARLPADLRKFVESTGVKDEVPLATFKQQVAKALEEVDGYDRGKLGGRWVPATGGCGSQTFEEERVYRYRAANKTLEVQPQQPWMARIPLLGAFFRLTAGVSNLTLDAQERAQLESGGSAFAKAMLTLADEVKSARGTKPSFAAHFPEPTKHLLTGTRDPDGTERASIHADAGATHGLAKVLVKDTKTDKWLEAAVQADGSYKLDLGNVYNKDYALWFASKSGELIFGGSFSLFYHRVSTTQLAGWTSRDGALARVSKKAESDE